MNGAAEGRELQSHASGGGELELCRIAYKSSQAAQSATSTKRTFGAPRQTGQHICVLVPLINMARRAVTHHDKELERLHALLAQREATDNARLQQARDDLASKERELEALKLQQAQQEVQRKAAADKVAADNAAALAALAAARREEVRRLEDQLHQQGQLRDTGALAFDDAMQLLSHGPNHEGHEGARSWTSEALTTLLNRVTPVPTLKQLQDLLMQLSAAQKRKAFKSQFDTRRASVTVQCKAVRDSTCGCCPVLSLSLTHTTTTLGISSRPRSTPMMGSGTKTRTRTRTSTRARSA